jgi:hypothetical protein
MKTMEKKPKEPIYDKPISPEQAQRYVDNYLKNKNFKPSDFEGFYFHRDEIQIVLDQNVDKEYIKFTLGMKEVDPEKNGKKLFGCVMMTSSDIIIPDIDLDAADDSSSIYDFSRPIPPYPPTEE